MEGLFNIFVIFGVVVFCASFSASAESSPLVTRTSRATLTTVQVRDTGFPKPTSGHRSLNVEPVEKSSSNPYDLFRVANAQRRRPSHNLFEWDYYCQAQPRRGDCTEFGSKSPMTEKYYYNAQNDKCKKFTYSGCKGNKNNFRTKVECNRHCKGASSMPLKNVPKSTYCTLQPSAGICFGLIERYYYDDSSKDCKAFLYGGCGGNQNRFNTYAVCMSRCKGVE